MKTIKKKNHVPYFITQKINDSELLINNSHLLGKQLIRN